MKRSLYKKFGEFDKKMVLKADSYQELVDKIDARLDRKYKESKVKWIWQIQSIFENWNKTKDETYTELCKSLRFTIESKAEWLERKYRNVRLSFHDFEAELWKITYEAIEYYESAGDIDTEFTLIETLEMYWATRIKSFIKSCLYTRRNSSWYTALSLSEDFSQLWKDESPNPEQQYLLKEVVFEMFNDNELNEKERRLLTVIYLNPNGSYREWGKEIGASHPETVKRLFINIQKKLSKYR